MNGYVAKPIRREELVAAMAEAVPDLLMDGSAPGLESDPNPEPPAHDLFDPAALLEATNGNRELALEMIQLCVEVDGLRLFRELSSAGDRGDINGVECAAHAIKGLVGEFHASVVYRRAHALEEAARERRGETLPAQATELEREFQRLVRALKLFIGQSADSVSVDQSPGDGKLSPDTNQAPL